MVRVSPVQGVGTDSPIRSSPQTVALLNRPPPLFFLPPVLDGLKNQKCSLGGRKEKEANRKKQKKNEKTGGKRGSRLCHTATSRTKKKEEKEGGGKRKKNT